jgi:hypothetical protein
MDENKKTDTSPSKKNIYGQTIVQTKKTEEFLNDIFETRTVHEQYQNNESNKEKEKQNTNNTGGLLDFDDSWNDILNITVQSAAEKQLILNNKTISENKEKENKEQKKRQQMQQKLREQKLKKQAKRRNRNKKPKLKNNKIIDDTDDFEEKYSEYL